MGNADSAILKNGRGATLTEAGWAVHPWTGDKKPIVFATIAELSHWGNTHDWYGKKMADAKHQPGSASSTQGEGNATKR